MLLNLTKIHKKKGSLILSFLASGVVAFTVVAAHQTTRRFVVGAGQGVGYQEAFNLSREALGLASLMVSRNIVICSTHKEDLASPTSKEVENKKCQLTTHTGGTFVDTIAGDYFNNTLKLRPDIFTPSPSPSKSLILEKNTASSVSAHSPLYVFLEKGGRIEWSHEDWRYDSTVSAVFTDLGEGVCRNSKTFEPLDHKCPQEITLNSQTVNVQDQPLSFFKLLDRSGDRQNIKCRDTTNAEVPETVCDYFKVLDNDGSMVFITIKMPFIDSSEGQGESQSMSLKGAIRKPLSIISLLSGDEGPLCSVRCEAPDIVIDLNGDENPPCVGLSDSGVDSNDLSQQVFPKNNRAHTSLVHASFDFSVKNYGPGVLHELEIHRRDQRNTNVMYKSGTVLSQNVVPALSNNGIPFLLPSTDVTSHMASVTDSIPCYDTSYYRTNSHICRCRGPEDAPLMKKDTVGQAARKAACEDMVTNNHRLRVYSPYTSGTNQEKTREVIERANIQNPQHRLQHCGGTNVSYYCVIGELTNVDNLCTAGSY